MICIISIRTQYNNIIYNIYIYIIMYAVLPLSLSLFSKRARVSACVHEFQDYVMEFDENHNVDPTDFPGSRIA